MKDRIEEEILRLNLISVIISMPDYQHIQSYGDFEGVCDNSLFKNLFSSKELIQNLYLSLNGQLLPTIWSQDCVDCFVSKLDDGTVYGIFSKIPYDPVTLYRISKKAASAIENIIMTS